MAFPISMIDQIIWKPRCRKLANPDQILIIFVYSMTVFQDLSIMFHSYRNFIQVWIDILISDVEINDCCTYYTRVLPLVWAAFWSCLHLIKWILFVCCPRIRFQGYCYNINICKNCCFFVCPVKSPNPFQSPVFIDYKMY